MDKKLNIIQTNFKDLYIVEPNSFKDERGAFSRVYCENEMHDIFGKSIKQINHTYTKFVMSFVFTIRQVHRISANIKS